MSGSVVFDTHKFVKQLTEAKMPKEQAEALADNYVSLLNDRLATKDDLRHLENRLATKDDVALIKTDIALIKTDIGDLKTKFTHLEDRVAAMIMKSQIVTITIMTGVMAILLQITG